MHSQTTYFVRTGSCISDVDFAGALVGSLEPKLVLFCSSNIIFAGGWVGLLGPELVVFLGWTDSGPKQDHGSP